MKKTSIFCSLVFSSAIFLVSCGDKNPVGISLAKANNLTMEQSKIDTTVVATPGIFIKLENNLIPSNLDTSITYVWEVVSSSTPDQTWAYSICDPEQCNTPGKRSADFKFKNGIPGFFYVDWSNSASETDTFTRGTCALTVRIFAKDNGDTLLYTTLMHI